MNADVDISIKLDRVEVELSQELVKKTKKFVLEQFLLSKSNDLVINIIVFILVFIIVSLYLFYFLLN